MNNFFATIYESFFYYGGYFSDDLFSEELYSSIGVATIISSLVFPTLFYFIINRPNFSKWHHWLIILGVNALVTFIIAYIIPKMKFTDLGYEYGVDYWLFGLGNTLFSSILFIVFSYAMKWRSTNARETPKIFFGKF